MYVQETNYYKCIKWQIDLTQFYLQPQEWYFDSLTNGTLRRLKGPKGWKQEKRSGLCMSKMRFQVLPTFG